MKVLIFLLASIGAAVCQSYGDVRLVGTLNSTGTGIVEVYLNGEWGSVMHTDYTGVGVGQAVCRQLGYYDVQKADTFSNMQSSCSCDVLNSSTPSFLSNGDCYGQNFYPADAPSHILQCYQDYTKNTNPDHLLDLVVQCSSDSIDFVPYDSQVHLVQGGTGYKSSGYVEVYLNLRWGPVCNMTKAAANTACRQLGYSYSASHRDAGGYTDGKADQLTDFTCGGSTQCLRNCFHYPSVVDTATCRLHSVVNCTFSDDSSYSTTYGSQSTCTVGFNIVAIAVGIVVALIVVFLIIIAIMCAVCCCIPGCVLYGAAASAGRRRVVYESI